MKAQVQVGKTNSTIDDSKVTITETISAKVHEQWMETKLSQGVTSRVSETGEELMVPYTELSEPAKDLDRNTVKTVVTSIDSIGSVIVPKSVIEKLKSLAQQKSWNDIINGQSDLAKEILEELGVNWDK